MGIVMGPGDDEGELEVKFPIGLRDFPPAKLRRQDERRSAAQVQEILARLAKPPVPALTTLQPCSADFGHALPKLLSALGNAKMAVVSTPDKGARGGMPLADDPFDVAVMSGLERLAGLLPTRNLIVAYDFAGSASKELHDKAPDSGWECDGFRGVGALNAYMAHDAAGRADFS